jgi:formamidopyrimidine-DNA glycosylase
MPELPEIASRAREMDKELKGKTIKKIEVLQPKCLNVSKKKFASALEGARILGTTYHGKWLFTETTKGHLLINMGMGGELLLVDSKKMPEKWRVAFHFRGGTTLSANFWWFGHTHYAAPNALGRHTMSAKLGPNAIDVTLPELREMLGKRRGAVKSFLLNQERIAGIGNAYIHDILFLARLHPLRTIDSLSDDEIGALWNGIQKGLKPSLRKRGAFYERDLYGKKGGFKFKDILIGYREGQPCPTCGEKIVKIRTGSTSGFICPKCQPLKSTKRAVGKGRKKGNAKKAEKKVAKKSAAKGAGKKVAKKPATRATRTTKKPAKRKARR